MKKGVDLTKGNISKTLIMLALPIMGTSFINMFYNLTDIIWLGRLSTKAVAAAGAVGFFTWFGSGLIMISQIGVGISVAQSYGKGNMKEMNSYISNAIKLDIFLAISYAIFLFTFKERLIGFFDIADKEVVKMSIDYLEIICIGLLFNFINPVISAIFNSVGNSFTPFVINGIGLITNIILDPILIFGLFGFPKLGIKGAAIATSFAQFVVTIFFIIAIYKNEDLFGKVRIIKKVELKYMKKIIKLGLPGFFQTSIHSGINMILARVVAEWGAIAVAVQTTGAQIESISWMTADGFATAITSFVGQNYGSGNYERVNEGYRKGLKIVSLIGLGAATVFILFGEKIFSLFTPKDLVAIKEGASYLRILGFSQIFICIEIASRGAFNGVGLTKIPASIAIVFNATRIPLAILLSKTVLGLDGVWWSLTVSSVLKGVIVTGLCIKTFKKILGKTETNQ